MGQSLFGPVGRVADWLDEGAREVVFFDSSTECPGEMSLVGRDAEEVIEGAGDEVWQRLATALEERAGDSAWAEGALCGTVEYGGRVRFGLFRRLERYCHRRRCWLVGGPERRLEGRGGGLAAADGKVFFRPEMGEAEFVAMVRRAQEYIAAGDIYQVNLSRRFVGGWAGEGSGFDLYRRLRAASPTTQAAYIRAGEVEVLSSSPELFLKLDGREVVTRPIKGTRPRGTDPKQDAKLAAELVASAKERAELLMITDLERNDLGQVCEFGSVEVPELMRLETYGQVFHLVSTVRGRLRAGCSHVEALRACLPGGSITGAPKRRAMEIIAELEPVPRGLYTGAIGYLGFDGRSQFNIAIRTIVRSGDTVTFHVGAGIVADSDPAAEFAETEHKARGMLAAAAG